MIMQMNESNFTIPENFETLEAFRKWTKSSDFPPRGRFSYLNGNLWADLDMEKLFAHNQIKAEITGVLRAFVKANQLGYFFFDRAAVTNVVVGFRHEPDGTFVSFDSIGDGSAQVDDSIEDDSIEITGTPDMVLEVVSQSSIKKDKVILRDLYWQAGIAEYWLVDARKEPFSFELLKLGEEEYLATRRSSGGWLKSSVFGRSFRITLNKDMRGKQQFNLEMKS